MGKPLSVTFFLSVLLGMIGLGLQSCSFSIDPPLLPYESLDFHEIVAFGDGYMAGFTNSARSGAQLYATAGLYEQAQIQSPPRLVAQQYNALREAFGYSPIAFRQPLVMENGSGHLEALGIAASNCDHLPSFAIIEEKDPNVGWEESVDQEMHNLAFPFLKVRHLSDSGITNQNPFVNRVFQDASKSYPELVIQQDAGFFLLTIGTNDVLEYALQGGEPFSDALTDPAIFAEEYEQFVNALIDDGMKGMIATLPDITQFPYFRTLPKTFVNYANCGALPRNIFIEHWDNNEVNIRTATASDRLFLTLRGWLGSGEAPDINGLSENNPVPHNLVLDATEAEKIRSYINSYNVFLIDLAQRINDREQESVIGIVRLDRTFAQINEGKFETGVFISGDYLTGGVFSLDGLYLTPRGNALIANQFIRSMNTFPAFAGTLPPLNLKDYAGVSFP